MTGGATPVTAARRGLSEEEQFYNGVPAEIVAEAAAAYLREAGLSGPFWGR